MRARSAALLLLVLLWAQLTVIALTVLWGYAFIAVFVALCSLLAGAFFATTAYSVLFGAGWASKVRDVPDSFFVDYRIGPAIP